MVQEKAKRKNTTNVRLQGVPCHGKIKDSFEKDINEWPYKIIKYEYILWCF